MAAVATSLSSSNMSSRVWDGRPPQFPPIVPLCHIAGALKSGTPSFLGSLSDQNCFCPSASSSVAHPSASSSLAHSFLLPLTRVACRDSLPTLANHCSIAPSIFYPAICPKHDTLQCYSFSVDFRDANAPRSRKARLHVARASPLKDSTREVIQSVQKETPSHRPPLRSEQDTEDKKTDIDGDNIRTDVVRHVEQVAEERQTETEPTVVEPKAEEERVSSANSEQEDAELLSGDTALKGTIVAGLLLVGVVGGFGAVSYLYRDQINDFLVQFSDFIEGYGPAGYALFIAVYAGLEILAIPAIPLTMSAGLLFGTLTATILVSISGTIAATAAFLIARYLARDRILKIAEGNKKFLAIDKAIGEDGFRVVALLRLSPLLPFSLGNYLYGLTSVKLVPYILGSWLGMLPGTWAYVSAGAFGRAFIQQEVEIGLTGHSEQLWTLGFGLMGTVLAATYVTRLAKGAIKDIE